MSNLGLLAICNITHIKPPVSEQTLADPPGYTEHPVQCWTRSSGHPRLFRLKRKSTITILSPCLPLFSLSTSPPIHLSCILARCMIILSNFGKSRKERWMRVPTPGSQPE